MFKWIGGIILALALMAGGAYLFREPLTFALFEWQAKPGFAFNDADAPPALNYAEDSSWAALPEKDDQADMTPDALKDQVEKSDVAVFFIHPTTYLTGSSWNSPTDDPDSSEFRDGPVLRAQASVFNGCCDVYAPKYRQATLWSFMDTTGSGEKARAFAFADETLDSSLITTLL